jgi:hypothetical protein
MEYNQERDTSDPRPARGVWTRRRVVKWIISTAAPSFLIFGFSQVAVSWNLSRLASAVEKAELTLDPFQLEADANWPVNPPSRPIAVNTCINGVCSDNYDTPEWKSYNAYWDETDAWVRGTLQPIAKSQLELLKNERARLKGLRFFIWGSSLEEARNSYVYHAKAWENYLSYVSSCTDFPCVQNPPVELYTSIEQTWNAAEIEYSRISPRFDPFNAVDRLDMIFRSIRTDSDE